MMPRVLTQPEPVAFEASAALRYVVCVPFVGYKPENTLVFIGISAASRLTAPAFTKQPVSRLRSVGPD